MTETENEKLVRMGQYRLHWKYHESKEGFDSVFKYKEDLYGVTDTLFALEGHKSKTGEATEFSPQAFIFIRIDSTGNPEKDWNLLGMLDLEIINNERAKEL